MLVLFKLHAVSKLGTRSVALRVLNAQLRCDYHALSLKLATGNFSTFGVAHVLAPEDYTN